MIRVSKFSLLVLSCSFISQVVYAQSFNEINKALKAISGTIQLGVRKYEDINPVDKFVLTQNSLQLTFDNWNMQLHAKPVASHPEALDVTASFKLTDGVSLSTVLAVSFDFSKWSRDNYLMVPAIFYNGNRKHSIGASYNPHNKKEIYYKNIYKS